MQFSRGLALVGGLALPVLETPRRWHQLGDWRNWPFWLDDWVIGALLLMGYWLTRRNLAHGRPYLAAACGFACSSASDSFFCGRRQRDHAGCDHPRPGSHAAREAGAARIAS
jgi:hypothetical protein